jgi:hypothetical protein
MRLDIVPFVPAHAEEIALRELDLVPFADAGATARDMGRVYAAGGPAFTGLAAGRVVACAGIVVTRPGLGDGWALTSPDTPRFALSFCRAFSRLMPQVIADFHLTRVQALVVDGHTVSRQWLARMGFGFEGTLRKYLNGRDYHMYARVA